VNQKKEERVRVCVGGWMEREGGEDREDIA
jgi:hypothetical protein